MTDHPGEIELLSEVDKVLRHLDVALERGRKAFAMLSPLGREDEAAAVALHLLGGAIGHTQTARTRLERADQSGRNDPS